jgi:hypothetical protein
MPESILTLAVWYVVVPIVALELFLYVLLRYMYHHGVGLGRAYIWISCIGRTLVYSPCILAGGHGAMPMPLGVFLFVCLRFGGSGFYWLYGIPAVYVLAVSYGVSRILVTYATRRSQAKKFPNFTMSHDLHF